MHNSAATNLVDWYTNPRFADNPFRPKIDFVSPVVATVLAAGAVADPRFRHIELNPVCQNYALTTGLSEALGGATPVGQTGVRHGMTYSRLTRLADHSEVDGCNAVIGDLLHEQIASEANQRFVHAVLKVVGELHDNVASHARGVGFSAAQLYTNNGIQRIEFAIADSGCGMLKNVTRYMPRITTDQEAMQWCLVRGNTTAKRNASGWEQRLPDDCVVSPFPVGVETFTQENHHVGEGLYTLTQLIRLAQGNLWMWSGNTQYTLDGAGASKWRTKQDHSPWQGLAIEFSLFVNRAQLVGSTQVSEAKLEEIAGRLGL